MINCAGEKKLLSEKPKNMIIFWDFPFFRGVQYFFCGLVALFRGLIWSDTVCKEKIKKGITDKVADNLKISKTSVITLVLTVLSVIFAGVVLGYLPGRLGYWIIGANGSALLRNFIIAFFKVILLALFLLLLKVFPFMQEFYRFNRACDLVKIYGENSKGKQKKGLCDPLNFLNYLIFVFFLDFIVVTLVGAGTGYIYNFLINLAIFLVCIMVCYEILWLIDISKLNCLKSMCFVTAFFVTAKPSTTHLETVLTAQTEINLLSSQKDRSFMNDENKKAFSVVYTEVRNKLQSARITDKSDADWIIATVLGKNRAEVKLVQYISDKDYKEIIKATNRRANGESVDNIFGFTEFYGLRFDVNKKVLTPRMETEILVEEVLKNIGNKTRILDLGTGSGAIAIAIAKHSDASVTAVDISKSALLTAQANAKKHDVKVEFIQSNLFENLKKRKKFDIIVSNPPYIRTMDIAKLDVNVKEYDPLLALDGGEDGLEFYRKICSDARNYLQKGGKIFFEIGKGQAKDVKKIMRDNGFKEIKTIKDYNKIERVLSGKYE